MNETISLGFIVFHKSYKGNVSYNERKGTFEVFGMPSDPEEIAKCETRKFGSYEFYELNDLVDYFRSEVEKALSK